MKKFAAVLLSLAMLAGCSSSSNQKVGDEVNGYLEVPSDWVVTEDTSGTTPVYEMTDKDQSYYLMYMYYYTADEIADANLTEYTALDFLQIDQAQIQSDYSDTYDSTSYSKETLDGLEAEKMYMTFTDQTTLAEWIFFDEAGNMHVITAEGWSEKEAKTMDSIVAGYSLK